MTFGSWDVDRYLLPDLEKPDWKAVTRDLKTHLSDTVIEEAVKRLPPEYYQLDGPKLETALKKRRDNLLGISNQFYRLLAHQVDIYMTHQSEHVIIDRIDKNSVEIRISPQSSGKGLSSVEPYYKRKFFRDETKEIRLHLLGGNDKVISQGDGKNGILIRVIGRPDIGAFIGAGYNTKTYGFRKLPFLDHSGWITWVNFVCKILKTSSG